MVVPRPGNLCAHSGIDFRIGESVLIRPSDDDWTVSAAALYLLSSRQQTKRQPVAEHLFPCWGNALVAMEGKEDVQIVEHDARPAADGVAADDQNGAVG